MRDNERYVPLNQILQAQGILTHEELEGSQEPKRRDELDSTYFMTKWRKEKEKMYCDQVFRLTEKGEQNPLRHSYSYTQKPFTTPEFGIKLDSYTQPGGFPSSSVAAQQAKPAQSLVKNQGLLEYLEPIG